MQTFAFTDVGRYLSRLVRPRPSAATADAELLSRFVASGDEVAFEALLARHGPMVWSVSRSLLYDVHAAEDAFAATWLVFVRKARCITRPERLANWLYGVAHKVAARARARAARLPRVSQDVDMVEAKPENTLAARELACAVHEELGRLPAKYREPLILHYLEGKSHEQAAQELGWGLGAFRGRLERGRERLRGRLVRRGVASATASAAGGVLAETKAAVVPPVVVHATLKAVAMLAGKGAIGFIPASVTVLSEGVLQAMFMTKISLALVVILGLGALACGGAVATYAGLPPQPAAGQEARPPDTSASRDGAKQVPRPPLESVPPDEPPREQSPPPVADLPAAKILTLLKTSATDPKLTVLLKGQWESARTEFETRWKEFCEGRGTLDILLNASLRLREAELDVCTEKKDQAAVLRAHWQRMKDTETINQTRYDAGRIPISDLAVTRFFRVKAEIALERAKAPHPAASGSAQPDKPKQDLPTPKVERP